MIADPVHLGRSIRSGYRLHVLAGGTEPDMKPRRPLPLALLLIQLLVGYEWLVSGLSKLVHGDFPGGLAAVLHGDARVTAGWYRSFLNDAVIPHANAFGYAIETAEVLTGALLVGVALAALLLRGRLSVRTHALLLLTNAAAALAGIAMAVNFHLAAGGAPPWSLPADSFDEAVDLDSLMAALQLVFFAVSVACALSLRRSWRAGEEAP